jgi:predicted metal-dependent hydrolase
MKSDLENGSILCGDRRISYRLHRGRRRTLRIAVSPDLSVDVLAPPTASLRKIDSFLREKAGWIIKTLDKFADYHHLPSPQRYVSGETLMFLGRPCRLEIESGMPRRPAVLSGDRLRVWDDSGESAPRIKQAVDAWYRAQAQAVFARCLERCLPAAARYGIPAPRLSVRLMRSRWGSCSGSGRITLSTRLVQVPEECIEYVVMHELCHLRHPNHSKSFYALLALCLPDWRLRKESLGRLIVC